MARSICLLSAGLDSSVALGLEVQQHQVAAALTIDYGQRAAAREIECARLQAEHYGIAHEVVRLDFFHRFASNSLIQRDQEIPRPSAEAIEQDAAELKSSADKVWVPNRNGVLLQVAAAFAEGRKLSRVVVGFNREEAQTFPDNSPEFVRSANQALSYSTRDQVTVHAPTADWNKEEILSRGLAQETPLHWLWSCYEGGSHHCGTCESCGRLLRAARACAVQLPLEFEKGDP